MERSFFLRGSLLLAIVLATALGAAHALGRMYHSRPLAPAPATVASTDRFIAIFGNSRFAAGIDPERLGANLSRPSSRVTAQMFSGGGWDTLHYYMLALLAAPTLRPGRDLVVIEVSEESLDDAKTSNRLAALRPEVARAIASLPGEPVETRLDILCGAIAGLYRYRTSVQGQLLAPWLGHWSQYLGMKLARVGLVGTPRAEKPYRLILKAGRDFVIDTVEGDQAALLEASRRRAQKSVRQLQIGGYKLAALRAAVELLRERGVKVVLVQTPTSTWLTDLYAHARQGREFETMMKSLRKDRHVQVELEWPAKLHDPHRFWDDLHMVAGVTNEFTDALAQRLHDDFDL